MIIFNLSNITKLIIYTNINIKGVNEDGILGDDNKLYLYGDIERNHYGLIDFWFGPDDDGNHSSLEYMFFPNIENDEKFDNSENKQWNKDREEKNNKNI